MGCKGHCCKCHRALGKRPLGVGRGCRKKRGVKGGGDKTSGRIKNGNEECVNMKDRRPQTTEVPKMKDLASKLAGARKKKRGGGNRGVRVTLQTTGDSEAKRVKSFVGEERAARENCVPTCRVKKDSYCRNRV